MVCLSFSSLTHLLLMEENMIFSIQQHLINSQPYIRSSKTYLFYIRIKYTYTYAYHKDKELFLFYLCMSCVCDSDCYITVIYNRCLINVSRVEVKRIHSSILEVVIGRGVYLKGTLYGFQIVPTLNANLVYWNYMPLI